MQIDLLAAGSPGGGGIAVTTTAFLAIDALRLDDAVRKRGAVPQGELHLFSPRFGPTDLGLVLDMAVETTTRIATFIEADLLDGPAPRHAPPAGSMTGDLDSVCAVEDLPYPRPDAHPLGTRRSFDPPAKAPPDDAARAAVVNEWLDTLVMAIGYLPNKDLWP